MFVEIDQSGKVEYTKDDTVIADSLGNSLLLPAYDKRTLQDFYRSINKPRHSVFQTFSALLAYLIAFSYNKTNYYIVDIEYVGWDTQIRKWCIQYIEVLQINIHEEAITFRRIGKKSRAHCFANTTFAKKLLPTKVLTLEDILKVTTK